MRFYGAATSEAKAMKDREVFVVGGANSAGQAAVHLARYAARVTMLVRDQADFTWIGVSSRKVPEDMPPGRALRNQTGIETQVALLATDASSHGQAAALAAIGEQATARDAGLALQQRPFRVDILPGRIGFAAAWQMRDPAMDGRPLFGLAGVGGDELTGLGPDLATGVAAFTIAGPIGRAQHRAGVDGPLAACRWLPGGAGDTAPVTAADLAGQPGVVAWFKSAAISPADLAAVVGRFAGPGVVLIDDADMTKDCEAAQQLAEIVTFGADQQRAVVCAGSPDARSPASAAG